MGKTVKMSFEGKSQQEPRNWQMDRILIILKKENSPMASSAPALGLNTIIFKHVYWYMQQTQVSVYRTIGPLVSASLLEVLTGNGKQRWNVCTVMVLLYIFSKILGVSRLPVCPVIKSKVLMLIKVILVYLSR